MGENDQKAGAPADTNSPAGGSSIDDAVALRADVAKATTATKACDLVLEFVLKRIGEAGGSSANPPVTILMKLIRPEGNLRIVKLAGADLKDADQISIERVGLGLPGVGLHATVHQDADDPFVAAYQSAKKEERVLVVAALHDTVGPWGALAVALEPSSAAVPSAVRLMRIASSAMSKWLSAKEGKRFVIQETPRSVMTLDRFTEHVDFLLSCESKGNPTVGLIAVRQQVPTAYGASKVTARNLRVALEQTRYSDCGTVFDDHTFLIALQQCGADALKVVAGRIRAALTKRDPKAGQAGVAVLSPDSANLSAAAIMDQVVHSASHASGGR